MPTFNLTISPSQSEFILKPGVTLLQAYNIINNSDTSITLNSEILPWIPSGSDGSVNYNQAINNPNIEFSLANSDLKIGQPFVISANSKQQLVLKIKSNPNTGLSDNYYTFFIFQNQNTTTSKDNFTQAVGKIGSHLLLTVSDTENPKIESKIENFSISPKIKDVFFGPITFNGVVKNNSNFFFKINGKITITKNDKIIKEFELNNNNVLNHHARNITCKDQNCAINPPLWPGHYLVKVSLDPSLNAKSYDTSFYVLPISPILFLLLVAGIIFGIKKFNSKPTRSSTTLP
ncbi:MAG: hypothetical protein PHO75_03115 [Candidatus Shapirobacteria bacterium]|nr:hypothetical protein [Candidatus Shapirobacteria bacterium]